MSFSLIRDINVESLDAVARLVVLLIVIAFKNFYACAEVLLSSLNFLLKHFVFC